MGKVLFIKRHHFHFTITVNTATIDCEMRMNLTSILHCLINAVVSLLYHSICHWVMSLVYKLRDKTEGLYSLFRRLVSGSLLMFSYSVKKPQKLLNTSYGVVASHLIAVGLS